MHSQKFKTTQCRSHVTNPLDYHTDVTNVKVLYQKGVASNGMVFTTSLTTTRLHYLSQ